MIHVVQVQRTSFGDSDGFVMFWLDRQNGKSAEKQYSNTRLFMPVLHCAARDVEPNLLLVAPVGLQTFLGRMAT